MGVWRKCISTKVSDMPQGWLDRAGVALIGETGKHVSNNHDVMSLEVRDMMRGRRQRRLERFVWPGLTAPRIVVSWTTCGRIFSFWGRFCLE